MAKLVLSSGGSIVHQCFLDKERLSVGRDPGNQVVIEDPAVAPEHAAITPFGRADGELAVIARRPHGYFITQVRGWRHARVNGQSIGEEARALAHGDVIDVANQKLEFRLG